MPLEQQTFASGDTDYISKLNNNISELIDTISALEVQVAAVGGGEPLSIGLFLDALFNRADALIGPGSYKPTQSASTLTVAAGGMYLQSEHVVVMSNNSVPLSFVGQPAGTYYIIVDTVGQPTRRTTVGGGAVCSVSWSGSGFQGIPVYIAKIFFDTSESDESRKSVTFNKTYATLDARLEASEMVAVKAQDNAESALAIVYEMQEAKSRKVGITVDGTTGLKGAIQIDFAGLIVGWSVIANLTGSLQVEVSRKGSLPPPAIPNMPSPSVDKISANAPIKLTSAQSAASAESGVSTWTTELLPWDVLQFNVISVSALTQATLYLRILEILPSPPVINPLEAEVFLKFREGDQ